MRFHDSIIGIAVALLGLAVLWLTRDFQNFQSHQLQYGPGFFPNIVASVMIAAGLVLAATSWRGSRAPFVELHPWLRAPALVANAALVLLAVVVYILLAEDVGFLIVAPVLLFVLIWRLWGRPLASAVIAAVTTIVMHQFFVAVLLVPLPWGLIRPFRLW
jgi:putative tricarboxylic transport membrane protein